MARKLSAPEGLEPGSDAHLRAVLDFFDLKRLTVQVGTTLLEVLGRRYSYVDEVGFLLKRRRAACTPQPVGWRLASIARPWQRGLNRLAAAGCTPDTC